MPRKKIVGYTAGAFDLFHIGHLNLLVNAKKHCDYLIVGVSTDEIIKNHKNISPIIPFKERCQIVNSIEYVDEVVAQDNLDKITAWERHHFDILFVGDDWKGDQRWIGYEKKLAERKAAIMYFPYTRETSSTKIRKILDKFK